MTRFVGLWALGTLAALLSPACGSDDGNKRAPDKGYPGGEGGDAAAGEPTRGGTAAGEAGETGRGAGGALGGAGGTSDVDTAGAGGVPLGNAGEPATAGAGSSGEGGSGGEATTGNVVYASFGTKLVWLEPETGALHEVGDMRSAQDDATYSEVVFAYGNVPGEAWIVTPRYNATANRPPPELGKLDLCTGVVSDLQTLTRVGTAPTALEGLALHPNGTWYVSTGANPPGPTQYLSNKLGTLNTATRVISDLAGTVDTLQNDMDSMVFVGDVLYGIDVATDNSRLELVTANLTTGTVTSVASPTSASSTAVPLRLAYDAARNKAYAWRPSDRNLLVMSLVDGTVTAVGETHASNVYPGEPTQGFVSAPACP